MFGNTYMVSEEFKELATGVDLTGIDDDALGSMLMQASREVDGYCHTAFGLNVVEMEQQVWGTVGRIYPNNTPVLAVRDMRLLTGSRQWSDISVRDLIINRIANYIEVVSIVTTASASAELISMGLSQPIAQYSYIFGTGEFDDSTANTAAALDSSPPSTGLSTFDVTDGTRFQVDDIIRIDNEEMLVTVIATNTLTVLRGINHREDAHANGADVYRMVSAAPDPVKLATGMIGGAYVAARRQREEGALGVRSFMIGSYSVTWSASTQLAGGAGFPFIPEGAQRLLEPYKRIALR